MQMPFSQREIIPELFRLNILATSFCFNPRAFLYFRRQLGIFLKSTFIPPLEINCYSIRVTEALNIKKEGKNCPFKRIYDYFVEKVGINKKT